MNNSNSCKYIFCDIMHKWIYPLIRNWKTIQVYTLQIIVTFFKSK